MIEKRVHHDSASAIMKGNTMKRRLLLTFGIVALLASNMPISAWAQEAKGKNCRMEQQCRWEKFKKICTWVKVCR